MSNLTIRFYSNCLRRYTTFKMYLPCDIRQDWGQTDTKYSENSTKTLFLLHGFTGDAENWVPVVYFRFFHTFVPKSLNGLQKLCKIIW